MILLAAMIGGLLATIVAGTAALVWDGQPAGHSAMQAADAFAWVFTAAFAAALFLAMLREQRRTRRRG